MGSDATVALVKGIPWTSTKRLKMVIVVWLYFCHFIDSILILRAQFQWNECISDPSDQSPSIRAHSDSFDIHVTNWHIHIEMTLLLSSTIEKNNIIDQRVQHTKLNIKSHFSHYEPAQDRLKSSLNIIYQPNLITGISIFNATHSNHD